MERGTTLVVDTGPLVAFVDRRDPDHDRCAALIEEAREPLIVPQLTIAEAMHLIGRRHPVDVELRLLADFVAGNFFTEPVREADWLRIAELVEQYADLPLGTVDASVVAAAERLGATTIATLDRRHFSVVRPRHLESFELLP
ncbi:MAG: PIN domain-containing protein [Actinobacteria bacterium]|nr:PIN domain-containing protein [Actinomycetota bacterium]